MLVNAYNNLQFVKVTVSTCEPAQLLEWRCSCVAGQGQCHHISALLYQIAHYSETDAVLPEMPAQTSVPQVS